MNNKLLKREEINELLNNTRPILNKETTEYLESIINLEFSVIKDMITDEQRKALNYLQIYRSALIYNIYKRDVLYFNNERKENGINFFNFYINSNDVPSIKLLIDISENDKNKIEIIRNYFYRLQNDYDLRENALTSGKKFVKKIPGLIIKKEFTK